MKFKGRFKRWNKKIRKARWRADKKLMISNGWVEVAENSLVPATQKDDFPPYIPTHLGGKVEKGRNVSLYKNVPGPPPRGEMRKFRVLAKKQGITIRQWMKGNW